MPIPTLETPPGPIVRITGREYLYFVGTGYLGLQGHTEVICAACEAARQYGIGSANSRTAFGTTLPLIEVEHLAAKMFAADDAFYFPSGWLGAHVLIQSLDDRPRTVLIDECSHYSLFEAARLRSWPQATFRHRDVEDLSEKLRQCATSGHSPLVLSDGVFAVSGHIAPVAEYREVLQNYAGGILYIDDAHGIGVLGENGRGAYEHAGLWSEGINHGEENFAPPALLCSGTLSKAVGGYGGIIPGGAEFIGRIKKHSPLFGGASPMPAPVAAATARAIELLLAQPELRFQLQSNAKKLKSGLRGLGFDVDDSPTPIVGLSIGSSENMRRIQGELMARGIAVAYMGDYAGAGPEGILRIAVFATHTEAMIARLVEELGRLV